MRAGDTARLYHRLTAYEPGREWDTPVDDPRVLRDFEPNVRATFPAHCKAYPAGLPVVGLPRNWLARVGSAMTVLAGRLTPPLGTLDLEGLARLLHLSAGVVRLAERKDGRRYRFRATGSAGGQFPFEFSDACALPPGS
jgi:hypothetical protein